MVADISKRLKCPEKTYSRLVLHVEWIVRVKQCIGVVKLSNGTGKFDVVTATRRPILPNTGVEGQLAAVSAHWHEQEGHYRTVDMLKAHCDHSSA